MILKVFTIFDSAVGAYLPPFFARSKGEALRSFTEACNDEKTNFCKYPLDYSLMYLGEYDDGGALFSCVAPVRVLAATEVKLDEPFTDANKVNGGKQHNLPM
jgi:hypothetical protein